MKESSRAVRFPGGRNGEVSFLRIITGQRCAQPVSSAAEAQKKAAAESRDCASNTKIMLCVSVWFANGVFGHV